MSQISKKPLDKVLNGRVSTIFLDIVARIPDEQSTRSVLGDMLTRTERVIISKRLAILYLLENGYNYRTISKVLNVSLTTIARMSAIRQTRRSGVEVLLDSISKQPDVQDFFLALDVQMQLYKQPKRKRHWQRV